MRSAAISVATFIALACVTFVGVDALPGDGCTALLGRFGSDAKLSLVVKKII